LLFNFLYIYRYVLSANVSSTIRQNTPIPKTIHKIFLTHDDEQSYFLSRSDLPERIAATFSSWEHPTLNPEYRLEFWNERRIRRFLKEEWHDLLSVYDAIKPLSWRANLARFAIIAKLGGWYADIQVTLLRY